MIAPVIVMFDEGVDLLSEMTRQVVVLRQDAVHEGLMPALDPASSLWVIWCIADMVHLLIFEPVRQSYRMPHCTIAGSACAEWSPDSSRRHAVPDPVRLSHLRSPSLYKASRK